MHRRVSILGVPIDALTRREALYALVGFSRDTLQHHVMTPNPEMLVCAARTPLFRDVLQHTSMNLPDGVGLLFAARFLGSSLPERVTGTDMMIDLCASKDIGSVFFLGAAPGVSERVARELQMRNALLQVAGTFSGSPSAEDEIAIIERIRSSGASVLFVAFGAPSQDLWIAKNLARMPSVKLAMGVGGAFDFVAGIQKRAPSWIRSLGCEWVWRLVREPRRFRRILTATVVFPLFVVLSKVRSLQELRGVSRTS